MTNLCKPVEDIRTVSKVEIYKHNIKELIMKTSCKPKPREVSGGQIFCSCLNYKMENTHNELVSEVYKIDKRYFKTGKRRAGGIVVLLRLKHWDTMHIGRAL